VLAPDLHDKGKTSATNRALPMYYVYILASRRHGTLYIGVTNSLQKRLTEHRNGHGSSFVKTYGVYRLVYVEIL
jgi:predicted GIY-YIG superfamily endonuclease